MLLTGFDNAAEASRGFTECFTRAVFDNGVGLSNQEQGVPLIICQVSRPWRTLWPGLRHYD